MLDGIIPLALVGAVSQQVSGLAEGFDYKGSVATVEDLPANPSQGDMYTVAGVKYVYDGTDWVEMVVTSGGGDGIPAPSNPSNGQYLMYNGSAWVAASLPLYNGGVT